MDKNIEHVIVITLLIAAIAYGMRWLSFAPENPDNVLAAFPQSLSGETVAQDSLINVTLSSVRYSYPPVNVEVFQAYDNGSFAYLGALTQADMKCMCSSCTITDPNGIPPDSCWHTVAECAALQGGNPDRIAGCRASKLFTPATTIDSTVCLRNPTGYYNPTTVTAPLGCIYTSSIDFPLGSGPSPEPEPDPIDPTPQPEPVQSVIPEINFEIPGIPETIQGIQTTWIIAGLIGLAVLYLLTRKQR